MLSTQHAGASACASELSLPVRHRSVAPTLVGVQGTRVPAAGQLAIAVAVDTVLFAPPPRGAPV